jgi:hypothetical protein
MPNTYARGILFGKLILELCEMSSIVCAKNDLRADVDFKAKVGSALLQLDLGESISDQVGLDLWRIQRHRRARQAGPLYARRCDWPLVLCYRLHRQQEQQEAYTV